MPTKTFLSSLFVCLCVSPILAQNAYLKGPTADDNDLFGSSVATTGDTLVVGSRFGGLGDTGTAVVFVRSGASWVQEDELIGLNTVGGDAFGGAVALEGDTLVVGASQQGPFSSPAPLSGAAYVFTRSGTTWTEEQFLKAPSPALADIFGGDVALSGDTLVVGAPGEGGAAGAAHVFVRSGTTWTHQMELTASNAAAGDFFGRSVGISGDTIVVGAPFEASSGSGIGANQGDNGAPSAGAAYVFTRSGTTWTQQAYLKASSSGASDQFGWSCTISGETIVVGAPFEQSTATGVNGDDTNNGFPGAGAAYVFVRSGSTWTQEAYVKASNTGFADQFGFDVALLGDALIVGAPTEESAATGVNGDEGDNSLVQPGAAYLFQRSGTTWTQRSYLKASNTDPQDTFGLAVAMSAANALVGAPAEDGAAVGVNGDDTDNSLDDVGAAYLYETQVSASVALRNAGSNPLSYSATAPVLGKTFDATVDLAGTTGHTMALLIGFASPLNVTLGSGQVLLTNLLDPSGEQLALSFASGPIATFQSPVPNDTAFAGLTIATQAIHFGGVFPFALSNAQDLVVGF